ncbi:MAG: cytochrome c oxidase subunit II [Oligoflexia bacterium]|nr:cytochrome c oxidase subunit II [Oligoflexia bacterium]
MFNFMPEQASEIASNIDWLNSLILWLSVFFTVAIVGAMVYFAVRYRRRDGVDHETPRIEGSNALEAVWTIVPTVICVFIAYYGVAFYAQMREEKANALEINVWAQKWKWDFEYASGKKTTAEFYVPVNRPVKLIMKSRDVLHSFFLPAMRVKRDVLPSAYNALYFTPIKTGVYQTFCTEYCGMEHSGMLATLHVVSQAEYDRWVNDRSEEIALSRVTPAERGEKLYNQKGCNACHKLDGSSAIAPSFVKLFGRNEQLADGTSVTVDENYLQESILHPNAKIVKGYPPNLMPAFEGQVSDDEIQALEAFIKSLTTAKQEQAAAAPADPAALAGMSPADRGKKLYNEKVCVTCHSLDGSRIVGPSFKGVYGRKQKITTGQEIVADDAYIKESILNSAAKVVEGYPPAMPAYQGQLSDAEVSDIIEFLKTVK